MKALVIGATGFVGTAVCRQFRARGYETSGLARSEDSAAKLVVAGVSPVRGDVTDLPGLYRLVGSFDLIVTCVHHMRELEMLLIAAIVDGCLQAGGERRFVFTSGTGVLATDSPEGLWSEENWSDDEEAPLPHPSYRALRMLAEDYVRRASRDGLKTHVIRPGLIWGHGGSSQVPAIFHSVKATGAACYVGRGQNLYSNIHVDDLAAAYCPVAERGTAGAVYHTVAGETNFREIAEAVAQVAGCAARSVSFDEACTIWGARYTKNALACNSRSTAPRARRELGWKPQHIDLIDDIRHGSYAEAWARGAFSGESETRWPG
ncbi:MAG: NAD-dependent epimerase/dehydratase family protein [Rhizobiaceae bacterium]|nr:NAD-dependent epimerase/dehydratase family protein [Rhizobiaceae bacterium]